MSLTILEQFIPTSKTKHNFAFHQLKLLCQKSERLKIILSFRFILSLDDIDNP